MADLRERIDEIKALLLSDNKAWAYSKLLELQEISAADSSAAELLADSSSSILSSVVADISYNDEEMYGLVLYMFKLNLKTIGSLFIVFWDLLLSCVIRAAQALKCLGFMIYHPAVVASIEGSYSAFLVMEQERTLFLQNVKTCEMKQSVWWKYLPEVGWVCEINVSYCIL